MNQRCLRYWAFVFSFVLLGWSFAQAQFPNDPTWTTHLIAGEVRDGVTVGVMEGLTGDSNGNFYVADRGASDTNHTDTCHVWRINANTGAVDLVGQITADPCRPSGLTFDDAGFLYITTAVGADNVIYRLLPNAAAPTSLGATGTVVVSGVPGNNGLAFDKQGRLYISDGVTNQGRVWRVTGFPANCVTSSNCVELFRIQPMRNDDALGGKVMSLAAGVGRQAVTFPGGTPPAFPPQGQDLVANGLAFNQRGDLYVADTARGAIWKVEFDFLGNVTSKMNCDHTFHIKTLCMENLWIADPRLEGIDGIALDIFGNVWTTANERNAIVIVTSLLKRVIEFFRNEEDMNTLLRNNGPMETPTSPFLSGRALCITHSDGGRRDNNPPDAGEGSKVSCMNQQLIIPGLPLPVD
jgi:sugar lactone lactonase YvrE